MGNRITNIFAGIDKAEPYHTHNGYPMGSDSNNHSGEVAPGQQRDDICMRKSPHSKVPGLTGLGQTLHDTGPGAGMAVTSPVVKNTENDLPIPGVYREPQKQAAVDPALAPHRAAPLDNINSAFSEPAPIIHPMSNQSATQAFPNKYGPSASVPGIGVPAPNTKLPRVGAPNPIVPNINRPVPGVKQPMNYSATAGNYTAGDLPKRTLGLDPTGQATSPMAHASIEAASTSLAGPTVSPIQSKPQTPQELAQSKYEEAMGPEVPRATQNGALLAQPKYQPQATGLAGLTSRPMTPIELEDANKQERARDAQRLGQVPGVQAQAVNKPKYAPVEDKPLNYTPTPVMPTTIGPGADDLRPAMSQDPITEGLHNDIPSSVDDENATQSNPRLPRFAGNPAHDLTDIPAGAWAQAQRNAPNMTNDELLKYWNENYANNPALQKSRKGLWDSALEEQTFANAPGTAPAYDPSKAPQTKAWSTAQQIFPEAAGVKTSSARPSLKQLVAGAAGLFKVAAVSLPNQANEQSLPGMNKLPPTLSQGFNQITMPPSMMPSKALVDGANQTTAPDNLMLPTVLSSAAVDPNWHKSWQGLVNQTHQSLDTGNKVPGLSPALMQRVSGMDSGVPGVNDKGPTKQQQHVLGLAAQQQASAMYNKTLGVGSAGQGPNQQTLALRAQNQAKVNPQAVAQTQVKGPAVPPTVGVGTATPQPPRVNHA